MCSDALIIDVMDLKLDRIYYTKDCTIVAYQIFRFLVRPRNEVEDKKIALLLRVLQVLQLRRTNVL